MNQKGPGLKHQRAQVEARKVSLSHWYERGAFVGEKATKFRKGACENCGAMTHKKKDCIERPRAVGAWKNGKDIAHDELVQPNLDLNFEGKRDRWNGYDASDYKNVVERFDALESLRAKKKAEEASSRLLADAKHKSTEAAAADDQPKADDSDSDDNDKDSDFKDDSQAVITQKRDPYAKTTSRNLRIREDTAKYLRNLDVNSAYYDPSASSFDRLSFAVCCTFVLSSLSLFYCMKNLSRDAVH